LLGAVYKFVHIARERVFRLWPSVARELVRCVTVLPFLSVDLRTGTPPVLLATDASELAGAAAVASFNTLGKPLPSWPLDTVVTRFWQLLSHQRWSFDEHINVLEMRAVLHAVATLVRAQVPSCRVPLLVDSSVVFYTLRKGRSRSAKLPVLYLCRRLAWQPPGGVWPSPLSALESFPVQPC
jgi:hypothetical protein